jgi:kelch-like protein 2/3
MHYQPFRLFAVGGYANDSYLKTIEGFDIKKQVWEEMPSMKSKRSSLGVVVVSNYLYAVGGSDGSCLNTMERFDLAEQVWEEMPSMNSERSALGVTFF